MKPLPTDVEILDAIYDTRRDRSHDEASIINWLSGDFEVRAAPNLGVVPYRR